MQREARPVWMPCSIDWPIDGDDPKRSEGGIPKNADGKNQASEDHRRMLCKRHLGFQEGKHVQNEKAVDSIHIGQEEAMVQRTKTFRTERCCIRTKG